MSGSPDHCTLILAQIYHIDVTLWNDKPVFGQKEPFINKYFVFDKAYNVA